MDARIFKEAQRLSEKRAALIKKEKMHKTAHWDFEDIALLRKKMPRALRKFNVTLKDFFLRQVTPRFYNYMRLIFKDKADRTIRTQCHKEMYRNLEKFNADTASEDEIKLVRDRTTESWGDIYAKLGRFTPSSVRTFHHNYRRTKNTVPIMYSQYEKCVKMILERSTCPFYRSMGVFPVGEIPTLDISKELGSTPANVYAIHRSRKMFPRNADAANFARLERLMRSGEIPKHLLPGLFTKHQLGIMPPPSKIKPIRQCKRLKDEGDIDLPVRIM